MKEYYIPINSVVNPNALAYQFTRFGIGSSAIGGFLWLLDFIYVACLNLTAENQVSILHYDHLPTRSVIMDPSVRKIRSSFHWLWCDFLWIGVSHPKWVPACHSPPGYRLVWQEIVQRLCQQDHRVSNTANHFRLSLNDNNGLWIDWLNERRLTIWMTVWAGIWTNSRKASERRSECWCSVSSLSFCQSSTRSFMGGKWRWSCWPYNR